jgi:eukaryotic-like serine/threonine-protein kinase
MDNGRESRIRFGPYDANLKTAELRKNGRVVRMQEQPFQVLAALLLRAGEVVTREELRERLWPGESFGDFDQGLNTAINKLREALRDSAANPEFIETLPKRGYRFMHAIEAEPAVSTATEVRVEPTGTSKPALLRVTAVISAIIAVVFATLWIRRPPSDPQLPLRRFAVLAPIANYAHPDVRLLAASPDGRHIAIIAGEGESKLWIQDLDQQQPRAVEGSEGALSPFWSPDSNMVGFAVAADTGKLKKVSIKGGPVITVCDVSGLYISGGSWSPDGASIVFTAGSPTALHIVPATGGTAKLLISPELIEQDPGEQSTGAGRAPGWISQPHFLPVEGEGRAVLFTYFAHEAPSLMVWDLKNGRHHTIGSGYNPFYSSTGHLLYRSGTDLWGRTFSLKERRPLGEAFRVARNATDPSVASDGTLIYRDAVVEQLVWLDRSGTRIGAIGQQASGFFYPALSPDGRRVAVETLENNNMDVWVSDIFRGTRIRLTTHAATDLLPVWAPEGDQLAFSSYRAGNTDIFVRRADTSSEEKALASTSYNERVSDWSRDGQHILYSLVHPKTGWDLWYLKRNAGKWEPYPLSQTSFNERAPKLSPDGRYVAYLSDESGRQEVYVRQFPMGGRVRPVSTRGASQIRWGRNGRELFYVEAGALLAVPVSTIREFAAGPATRLFSHAAIATPVLEPNYDVSADGQRFILTDGVGSEERMIRVVQNWFAEFRDRR